MNSIVPQIAENLKYFYRIENDNYIFPKYTLMHLFVVCILLLMVYFLYINKEKIKSDQKLKRLVKNSLIFFLLFQQINFLFFYIFIKKTGFRESLPLYTCRIAIYTSLFSLINGNKKLKSVTVYLGIVGAIVAFISPDLESYNFPHVMFVNYFLTHYLILLVSAYYIFIENYEFKKEGFIFTIKFLNLALAFILLVNIFGKTNYAYLMKSPILNNVFDHIPYIIYVSILALLYNFSIIITYLSAKKILKKDFAILRIINKRLSGGKY